MQSNRKSHLVLVRMGNALPILEESFMSFLTKLNIVLLYDWATALLYIYLPHLKFYVQKKNLYTIIDSSIIFNCQNMETANLSIGKWMNILWYILQWNTIQQFKEWAIKQSKNVNECILLSKIQHCNTIHSGSIYVTLWEK